MTPDETIAQLRADLARERELTTTLDRAGHLIGDELEKEKARVGALEKELAEANKTVLLAVNSRERMIVDRESAESRLAAMQKHADALVNAAEALTYYTEKGHPGAPCERTGWINSEMMDEYRAALTAYRAFTAEREKEKK